MDSMKWNAGLCGFSTGYGYQSSGSGECYIPLRGRCVEFVRPSGSARMLSLYHTITRNHWQLKLT